MDSRIGIRSAAFPDHRGFETAGAPDLAFAFLALSAVCSRLGLLVPGLEQRGTSPYRVWNRSGPDPVRRDAAQSAALVVLFLVSCGLDSVWIDHDHSPGDRSVVQQIRAVEQGASRPGCFH